MIAQLPVAPDGRVVMAKLVKVQRCPATVRTVIMFKPGRPPETSIIKSSWQREVVQLGQFSNEVLNKPIKLILPP